MIDSITGSESEENLDEFYEALRDAQSLRSAAEAVDVTMPKWMGEVMRRSADSIDRMVGEIRLMQIEAEEARGIK